MPKSKDILTPNLFEDPKKRDSVDDLTLIGNKLVDTNGNIYDPDTRFLIKESPSEGLRLARKRHPDWTDEELSGLAKFYNRQLNHKGPYANKKS
jgi:hypothetical protein